MACGVARDRGERVRAIARSSRVERHRVRRRGVFRAECGPVPEELDADDTDVVCGVGRDA